MPINWRQLAYFIEDVNRADSIHLTCVIGVFRALAFQKKKCICVMPAYRCDLYPILKSYRIPCKHSKCEINKSKCYSSKE